MEAKDKNKGRKILKASEFLNMKRAISELPKQDATVVKMDHVNGRPNSSWVSTSSPRVAETFVRQRAGIHISLAKEEEKTKRLYIFLAVILLISALAMILYAPRDKEVLSYFVGGALLIAAGGAAGYKRIWAKSDVISFSASEGEDGSDIRLS